MQFDLSQNWAVEFHCQLTWAVTSWLSAELPDARYSFNSARRYFIHDVKTRRTFELRMHVMYSAGHHRKLLRSSKLYLELTSLRDQASINIFKTLTLVKKSQVEHLRGTVYTLMSGVSLGEWQELWHFLMGCRKSQWSLKNI